MYTRTFNANENRLSKLYYECLDELNSLQIVPGTVNDLLIGRFESKWGDCHRNFDGTYRIRLSRRFFNENASDEAIKNTLMHELLHTLPGCMNHGKTWKAYANLVNDAYAFYHIKRTTSADEKNMAPRKVNRMPYKYLLTCDRCGKNYNYKRDCSVVRLAKQHSYDIWCRCGCHLFTVYKYGSHNNLIKEN